MEVDQTEVEEGEAAETANEAEEQPDERDEEMQRLMDYCLSLEDENRLLESQQIPLPMMTDSVPDRNSVHVHLGHLRHRVI